MKKLSYFLFSLLPLSPLMWGAPIEINSQKLEIATQDDNIVMVFQEDAVASGENFTLSGDCLKIISSSCKDFKQVSNGSTIKEICATENPSFQYNQFSGTSDRIIILPQQEMVILEGNASITDQEHGTVKGERLVLDAIQQTISNTSDSTYRSHFKIDIPNLPQ